VNPHTLRISGEKLWKTVKKIFGRIIIISRETKRRILGLVTSTKLSSVLS
jgi:hypothetical protein